MLNQLLFLLIVFVYKWFLCVHSLPVPPHSGGNISCEYDAMSGFLHEIASNYSDIAQLVSIGTTDEGRDIWTMIVSDSPKTRPLLRPQVKFVGNLNGMSGPACYVLLRFIKHLVEQYQLEASMERKLLESVEIHIIPNLNPDGYARAVPGSCFGKDGRLNSNGVNLNENFPDIFKSEEEVGSGDLMQKETFAMIRWMDMNKFTLSVSVISGARVVVYPFDTIIVDDGEGYPVGPHLTPDDDIFKHLASAYADKTGTPEQGWHCPRLGKRFPGGIINGAEWQHKQGTMMDFNYIHGTFEIMVGVSCCRNEANSTLLDAMWWENSEALLHQISEVDSGIRGQVLDAETDVPIADANLSKREFDYEEGDDALYSLPWYTTKRGEFWRPWQPGYYRLRVEAAGYKVKLVDVEVHLHKPTFLRVELEKLVNETATVPQQRVTSTTTAATTTTITTTTVTTPSSTVFYSFSSGGQGQNESIKKMSGAHQLDGFSFERKDTIRVSLEDSYAVDTQRVTETTANESTWGKPVVRSSTSMKHYSSLTQIDHSFINLFRGIDGFRNNSGKRIKCNFCICKIITLCLMACFLSHRFHLAVKENNFILR